MKDNIYISTFAVKERNLEKILGTFLENGFTNVELGAGIDYSPDSWKTVLRFSARGLRFLMHNYFPRPKEDFVINLASDNETVLSRSMEFCKRAIDFSREIKAPFYSVHAGFAFHASPSDLGREQASLPRIPYKEAYRIFVESVSKLAAYALRQDVKLAIENNVVAGFNLTDGKNEVLLLAEAQETAAFYKEVNSSNLFFLIDLGHLKVTAKWLKFGIGRYLEAISPHAIAFHLSDNDSVEDQHCPFGKDAWFDGIVRENDKKTMIIESRCLDAEQLKGCCAALDEMLSAGTGRHLCKK